MVQILLFEKFGGFIILIGNLFHIFRDLEMCVGNAGHDTSILLI